MVYNNRIQSCYCNTSRPFDKKSCRFSCHLHFKYSVKILSIDVIRQSYIKLLVKHFATFRQNELSLFLSSPFQIFHEKPDNWWYTTIVYKAVTATLHAVSTNCVVAFLVISISNNRWRCWQMTINSNRNYSCYWKTSSPFDNLRCQFSCHLHFKYSMKILTIDGIQQSYTKLLLQHFATFRQNELSLFLSSPFQIFHENPDNWWYTTIVYRAVTATLHAVSTNCVVAFLVISISNNRWRCWQMTINSNRKYSCYWNTSRPFDKFRCHFSCHLHFKYSMKILRIDHIQQPYIKLLLEHFTPFRQIEVSIFLSSPFQMFDEDPDNWWYTTIVYKAVTATLHAFSTNWGVAFPVISSSINWWRSWELMMYNKRIKSCYWNTSGLFDNFWCQFSCHLHFKYSMKILTIDDIQQSYIKLLLKHFMPFRQFEVSFFLSSPFQLIDEDPQKWWYTTIVYEAVTGTIHAVSTNWGVDFPLISISNIPWRSWQLMIYNNRIQTCYCNTSRPFDKMRCRFSCHLHFK